MKSKRRLPMPIAKSRGLPLTRPPLAALKKLEKAACGDLTVARLTLGLINAICGGEPSLLFLGYHWRLNEVTQFPPDLVGSAQQLMAWGSNAGIVLNELMLSETTIATAVFRMRRQFPYARRRIAIADRWRKKFPQLKPADDGPCPSATPLRAVDILSDEVGRPLSDCTLRLAHGFNPSQIEILVPNEGEYHGWRLGGIRIRLEADGYVPDFVSQSDEAALIEAIDRENCWSHMLKRRVQHFGYRYDYRARRIDASAPTTPFPGWLEGLAQRIRDARIMTAKAEQAIVNEYLPGQGIASHIDCEPCFGPEIVSVSLGSGCELLLKQSSTGRSVPLYLEARCALILSGESRYLWTHGIPARQSDLRNGERLFRRRRISITFRTIVRGATAM